MNLIVDVGTNAEIVLGDRDRLLEPGQSGVRGRADLLRAARGAGAIERVRIDRQTLSLGSG